MIKDFFAFFYLDAVQVEATKQNNSDSSGKIMIFQQAELN